MQNKYFVWGNAFGYYGNSRKHRSCMYLYCPRPKKKRSGEPLKWSKIASPSVSPPEAFYDLPIGSTCSQGATQGGQRKEFDHSLGVREEGVDSAWGVAAIVSAIHLWGRLGRGHCRKCSANFCEISAPFPDTIKAFFLLQKFRWISAKKPSPTTP